MEEQLPRLSYLAMPSNYLGHRIHALFSNQLHRPGRGGEDSEWLFLQQSLSLKPIGSTSQLLALTTDGMPGFAEMTRCGTEFCIK